ncbi:protein of unknown function [Chitinophaga costaii]|uniref:DUF4249 domain-containing protein n=1 Tax=Chitinophaga costaii TaxID=1335309 RepID=A0A1C4E4R7_9BACT|nr:DUF4249 domain-containing protein [Chitinophaga costaii]PUZ24324.1 DUF4249 domain-containing protein [Chitinophaga costaii]SCC38589.1 protein of unknown function [Chitinophaga costaii]
MQKFPLLLLLATGLLFGACTDVIKLDVPNKKNYPVLDAVITDQPGVQKIRFTNSVPYQDDSTAPVITTASMTLLDVTDNNTYPFIYGADGYYSYNPGENIAIGKLGHVYKLHIEYQGEIYEAYDTIKRIPEIDSVTYKYKSKEDNVAGKEGYFARVFITDIKGATDHYWLRAYRNNLQTRNTDAFAIDGAFNEGLADGFPLILPLSESITRDDKPYQIGDTVIVQFSSLTYPTYNFMNQAYNQINNGGLFASVLENVKSNALNVSPSSTQKILGWFSTNSVRYKSVIIQP